MHVGTYDAQEGKVSRITPKVLQMLENKEEHALDLLPYSKIFLTQAEPPNARGNINVMFKLISFNFIVLFSANEKSSNIFIKLFY